MGQSIILAMATEFTKEQIAAFNDAFELFDRSGGKRLVAWTECANLARCFGYNPTNQYVLHLLGGDEIDTMPKSQLAEKTIGLDDFLPHLWTISQAPDPGCYEEFFEGLKDFDKLLDGHEDADGNVKYDHFIKTILSDKEEAK